MVNEERSEESSLFSPCDSKHENVISKSDLAIYHSSGISEIFGPMLSNLWMAGQKNRWLVAVFAAVCALRWPSYNESSSLQKRAKFEAKYIVNHD